MLLALVFNGSCDCVNIPQHTRVITKFPEIEMTKQIVRKSQKYVNYGSLVSLHTIQLTPSLGNNVAFKIQLFSG